ncbi:hypothetical protein [Pontibacter sp. SGAir0037]|uniref:hypothetical protein n=1 Tax=Pontibacter sp. SGAir0037 TaxID=2571030 RepID=UPI0010CD5F06|nr:hypothetical protein [Pontibacter sp. SGAir0037]QCR22659.1 hypothetical protein C1N53_10105 [Pontibacter sp. SGAir0037]
MKKLHLVSLLILCLFSFTFVSCDKDDDEIADPAKTMLTAGEWTAETILIDNMDIALLIELFPEYEDIFNEMFDFSTWKFKFEDNGTANVMVDGEGGNTTWEFANNQQSIIFAKGTSEEFTAKINRLTDTELYLEMDKDDFPVELEGEEEGIELDIEKIEIRFKR